MSHIFNNTGILQWLSLGFEPIGIFTAQIESLSLQTDL